MLAETTRILNFMVEAFLHVWPFVLVTIPIAVAVKATGASRYIERALKARPAVRRGLEVLVSGAFGRVSVGADLMLQDVDLVSPGASRSTRPENVPEQVATLHLALPLAAGLSARVVELPKGLDPDEVLRGMTVQAAREGG